MKPTSPLKASESLTREIRQNKLKEPSKNVQAPITRGEMLSAGYLKILKSLISIFIWLKY